MPHIIIEYSANLESEIDMSAFCEHVRKAAVGIDMLPMPGIRVRALRTEHYAIADGNPQHAFVDISIRLRAGREPDAKTQAVNALFLAAKSFLSSVMACRSLALSMEMRDIDPRLSPKTGTIRDYL